MGEPSACQNRFPLGAFVAGILSAGADLVAKGALGAAGKYAYEALRDRVARWAGRDVEQLEARPEPNHRAGALAEVVEDQPQDEQAIVQALAETLKQQLEANGMSRPVLFKRITVIATHGGYAAGGDQIFGAPPKGQSDGA
ncbi:MAG: hypothetical protein ACFB22_02655 [Rhodothalassiaceae bacterium]